ncbi:MAG TPA: tonB-system energizer ExbB [Thalassobaculum sp.]
MASAPMRNPGAGVLRGLRPVAGLLAILLFLLAPEPGLSQAPTGAEQPAGGTTTDGTVTDETITDGTTTPEDGAAAGTPVGGIHAIDTAQLPHNLSPWGMFVSADMVVKAVMIGLVIASVLTWTILLAKQFELAVAMRRQRRLLAVASAARSLAEAAAQARDCDPVVGGGLRAALEEMRLSADALHDPEGLKERVASSLERIDAARGRLMGRSTGLLATIGSIAPFVGLFGTVWGIMNAFIGISEAQTTNLAVVAPGIAEALLATALGLVAAIPAVVVYNHFARRITAYKALIADTSAAVLRLVSRDLSRGVAMQPQPARLAGIGD